MSVRRGSKTVICPLEIRIKNQTFLEKTEIGILIPIDWFDSCNNSFIAGVKLTLHKSQVRSYNVMQWWACNSLMFPPLPEEVGCESRERIVVLLLFTALQQHGNKSSKVHFILR